MDFVKFRYRESNVHVIPPHYTGWLEEKVETKTELKFVAKQHVWKEKQKLQKKKQKQLLWPSTRENR